MQQLGWHASLASPRESMLVLQQQRGESGSRQWCDKLRFLIFIALIYSFPLLRCHPSTPHYPHPSATPPSCFPFPSILWNGRPIAVVMREVNWPCCVFRRLDRDDGSGRMGDWQFSQFSLDAHLLTLCCFHIIWNLPHWESSLSSQRAHKREAFHVETFIQTLPPFTLFNYSGVTL